MFEPDPASAGIDLVAHVIQTALTPVFLLSGIAALLNVFASRLARVSDRSHLLSAGLDHAAAESHAQLELEIGFLRRRTRLLDLAVLLSTCGGAATCLAALLLFVGSLRNATIAGLLYLLFGLALICVTGALGSFLGEVLLASRGLRQKQAAAVRNAHRRHRAEPRREAPPRAGP